MGTYHCKENTVCVVKKALFLAWKACGGPLGMGILQDKPNATEDDVFKNVLGNEDYPIKSSLPENEIRADYVFGRMMKIRISFDNDNIYYPDISLSSAYQSWSKSYNSYEELFKTAEELV